MSLQQPLDREPVSHAPAWTVALLALVAVALPLWLHRAWASGEAILYHGDSLQLQFPRYVTLCEALQRRDFPLWQALVYGGSPFHANPENPTLYPPTLLLAAFASPVWTINATVLIHLALAGLGAFALVMRLGRRSRLPAGVLPAGALVGATIFALSHFTRRDHLNLVAYGAAHAWIPWMLLAADGLLHGPRPRRSAGLLALCVAAVFFTGGLYVIPYAYLALVVWMVFEGLLGDREARRRALSWGTLAALAAGLMIAAKLLPYREWLPTTNRSGRLALEEALGTSLGTTSAGGGSFAWDDVWRRCQQFLGRWWVLLPGLLSLALLRERVVRLTLGLIALGFLIGLGGATWRFFYDWVPPFGQVRSAVRAWTLVNAFFPLAAGLGTAWLLSRPRALRVRPALTALLGVAAALALVRPLTSFDVREPLLWEPERLAEVRTRYPRWQEAARMAGGRWRVAFLERDRPEGRNEQFATSLLGAETVAGYQGHVWPARLEQHLYGPPERRVDRATRMRRLGALSAKWLVVNDPAIEPTRDPAETDPPGIEGTALIENPHARARLTLPSVVVGVLNDEQGIFARALLDHPDFPVPHASIVHVPWSHAPGGPRTTDAELAALDVLVVSVPLVIAGDLLGVLRPKLRNAAEVFEFPVHWDEARRAVERDALVAFVRAGTAARRTVELGFEREGPDRALLHVLGVDQGQGRQDRFVVASEPWSWYPGWELEGLDEPPLLRIADGVASAFLLPAEVPVSPLVAVYRPRSFRAGLAVGVFGLLLALGLVLAPARRAAARRTPVEPGPPARPPERPRGPLPLPTRE